MDIGFVLNRERADVPILWDCVAGIGSTPTEGLVNAAERWIMSTLPVCLEFLTGDESFAEHFHGDDPQGCPGWHVIHGPLFTYGNGSAPGQLQNWAIENPLLPVIGTLAAKSFRRELMNCVKLLFGFTSEVIAEVRVNGEYSQAASEHLRSLSWPRSEEGAFARCYLLFVHAE